MASVASQLIEEVIAYEQSDSLEDAREICADGIYFPNNLRIYQPIWQCMLEGYNIKVVLKNNPNFFRFFKSTTPSLKLLRYLNLCNISNHWLLFLICNWWGYGRRWRKGITLGSTFSCYSHQQHCDEVWAHLFPKQTNFTTKYYVKGEVLWERLIFPYFVMPSTFQNTTKSFVSVWTIPLLWNHEEQA